MKMMPVTKEERVRFLLGEFDVQKFYSVQNKASRYPSFNKLIRKFQDYLDGNLTDADRLKSLCDEIAVANWLFTLFQDTLTEAVYEQELPGGKNIDFLIKTKDGRRIYFDVKTLNPDAKDGWDNYQKINAENLFSGNTHILLDKDWRGGELFHKMYTARKKMRDHALGLEEKITNTEKREKDIFTLILCGKGTILQNDWVEDFAHFYFFREHRQDDPWGKMESHDIGEQEIHLCGSIDYFVHMKRGGPGYTPNAESDKIIHCETPDRFIIFGPKTSPHLPEFEKGRASEKLIDEAKEKLLAAYDPKAIYLFGSYVWGIKLPDSDSDLDFMVIVQDDLEGDIRRRSMKGQNALAHFPFPKDILVYTITEFERMAASPSTLCYSVKNKGKILYEAP